VSYRVACEYRGPSTSTQSLGAVIKTGGGRPPFRHKENQGRGNLVADPLKQRSILGPGDFPLAHRTGNERARKAGAD